jgi:UDP-3-O-[3-hydroxymyristoyl] glucosamine N-acyltransferase
MREPTLSHRDAAELLDADIDGEATVAELWDPQAIGVAPAGAVAVASKLDAELWKRLIAAGVAAVVAKQEAFRLLPPRGANDPARWSVADPRLAFARLTRTFNRRPSLAGSGVSELAVVDASATLGAEVALAAGVVVGPRARLEAGVRVGAGSVIGADVVIGPDSELRERVVLADGVVVGARCFIQAGAVIGSEGFGYALSTRGAERIHHLGSVVIGDDVDIGANTTIDRGTLGSTRIGQRVKIDNLVLVAHNVDIGDDTVVAGLSGIAGSTRVGARVLMGAGVGLADGIQIGDDARIAARSGVHKSVPAGETWGGYPALPISRWLRERYLIGRLEKIWSLLKGRA